MVARYKLKTINNDFCVTEVSLIPELTDKDSSVYTYILLYKSGYTTFEAQSKLKIFYSLNYSGVSAQGLKDEDAITSQIISIKRKITKISIKRFNEENKGENYIRIERIVGYGLEPVTPGILHGNCFRVVLRGLSIDVANKLFSYCKKNHSFNFINYYDSQRFGTPSGVHNTHIIGKNIIENDWKTAYREIIKSNNEEAKELINHKVDNAKEAKELLLNNINPNKIRFFVKSYCSYLWNKGLSEMISQKNLILFHNFKHVGDLALPVEDIYSINNVFECPGYSYSIDDQAIKEKVMRRTSTIYTTINAENVIDDSYNTGKKSMALNFFLPTGSYGTMLIRQLFLKLEENAKKRD